VDPTGRQVLEPRLSRVREVHWQVADDDLVGGGAAQLARQVIIIEPYSRVRLPCVLVDRGGLVEALRKSRYEDLPAEHAGPRRFRRR
jgi:hypothetical protein